jgi:hypothetical protein
MPLKALSLKINAPTDKLPIGRGFYQLEEETLFLPVEYPSEKIRFFSYLESDTVTLHIDRNGRLMFIELSLPRRRWEYKENLVIPEKYKPADIRFLDFRKRFTKPKVFCNKTREQLMIRFGPGPAVHNYGLTDNMIAQVDDKNQLETIWVDGITDDFAGKAISSWRKTIHDRPDALSAKQVAFQKAR